MTDVSLDAVVAVVDAAGITKVCSSVDEVAGSVGFPIWRLKLGFFG